MKKNEKKNDMLFGNDQLNVKCSKDFKGLMLRR